MPASSSPLAACVAGCPPARRTPRGTVIAAAAAYTHVSPAPLALPAQDAASPAAAHGARPHIWRPGGGSGLRTCACQHHRAPTRPSPRPPQTVLDPTQSPLHRACACAGAARTSPRPPLRLQQAAARPPVVPARPSRRPRPPQAPLAAELACIGPQKRCAATAQPRTGGRTGGRLRLARRSVGAVLTCVWAGKLLFFFFLRSAQWSALKITGRKLQLPAICAHGAARAPPAGDDDGAGLGLGRRAARRARRQRRRRRRHRACAPPGGWRREGRRRARLQRLRGQGGPQPAAQRTRWARRAWRARGECDTRGAERRGTDRVVCAS